MRSAFVSTKRVGGACACPSRGWTAADSSAVVAALFRNSRRVFLFIATKGNTFPLGRAYPFEEPPMRGFVSKSALPDSCSAVRHGAGSGGTRRKSVGSTLDSGHLQLLRSSLRAVP